MRPRRTYSGRLKEREPHLLRKRLSLCRLYNCPPGLLHVNLVCNKHAWHRHTELARVSATLHLASATPAPTARTLDRPRWSQVPHALQPLGTTCEGLAVRYVVDNHDLRHVLPLTHATEEHSTSVTNSHRARCGHPNTRLRTCLVPRSRWLKMLCPAESNRYSSTCVFTSPVPGMFTTFMQKSTPIVCAAKATAPGAGERHCTCDTTAAPARLRTMT